MGCECSAENYWPCISCQEPRISWNEVEVNKLKRDRAWLVEQNIWLLRKIEELEEELAEGRMECERRVRDLRVLWGRNG